jgi:hypothetical protein
MISWTHISSGGTCQAIGQSLIRIPPGILRGSTMSATWRAWRFFAVGSAICRSVSTDRREGQACREVFRRNSGPEIEDRVVAQRSVCALTLYRVVLPSRWGESA